MMERITSEQCLEKVKRIEALTKELVDTHPFDWDSMGRALLESLHNNAVNARINIEVQLEFSDGKK